MNAVLARTLFNSASFHLLGDMLLEVRPLRSLPVLPVVHCHSPN
jgi:hypothetical protein